MIRDLCHSKQKTELLASRLKARSLIEKVVSVSHHRKRNKDSFGTFKVEGPLRRCHDIDQLFQTSDEVDVADEWKFLLIL